MEISYFKIRNKNTGKWIGIQSREDNGRIFSDSQSAFREIQEYHKSQINDLEIVKLSTVRGSPDDLIEEQCHTVTLPFATVRSDILEDAVTSCRLTNKSNLYRNVRWFEAMLISLSKDREILDAAIEEYGPLDNGFLERLVEAYDDSDVVMSDEVRTACYYAKRLARRLNLLKFDGAREFDMDLLVDYLSDKDTEVPNSLLDHYQQIAEDSCRCEPKIETLEVYIQTRDYF